MAAALRANKDSDPDTLAKFLEIFNDVISKEDEGIRPYCVIAGFI